MEFSGNLLHAPPENALNLESSSLHQKMKSPAGGAHYELKVKNVGRKTIADIMCGKWLILRQSLFSQRLLWIAEFLGSFDRSVAKFDSCCRFCSITIENWLISNAIISSSTDINANAVPCKLSVARLQVAVPLDLQTINRRMTNGHRSFRPTGTSTFLKSVHDKWIPPRPETQNEPP